MFTPAAFACWAKTVAVDTIPAAPGVVCRSTVSPSLPAAFSSDFAWGMSCTRCARDFS